MQILGWVCCRLRRMVPAVPTRMGTLLLSGDSVARQMTSTCVKVDSIVLLRYQSTCFCLLPYNFCKKFQLSKADGIVETDRLISLPFVGTSLYHI